MAFILLMLARMSTEPPPRPASAPGARGRARSSANLSTPGALSSAVTEHPARDDTHGRAEAQGKAPTCRPRWRRTALTSKKAMTAPKTGQFPPDTDIRPSRYSFGPTVGRQACHAATFNERMIKCCRASAASIPHHPAVLAVPASACQPSYPGSRIMCITIRRLGHSSLRGAFCCLTLCCSSDQTFLFWPLSWRAGSLRHSR
jgi:hypothetical protein